MTAQIGSKSASISPARGGNTGVRDCADNALAGAVNFLADRPACRHLVNWLTFLLWTGLITVALWGLL